MPLKPKKTRKQATNETIEQVRALIMEEADGLLAELPADMRQAVRDSLIETLEAERGE